MGSVCVYKKDDVDQVIQAVTFSSPNVGGHQQPLKGPLNHPKKVILNHQGYVNLLFFFVDVCSPRVSRDWDFLRLFRSVL